MRFRDARERLDQRSFGLLSFRLTGERISQKSGYAAFGTVMSFRGAEEYLGVRDFKRDRSLGLGE